LTGLFEFLVEHGPVRERFVAGFRYRAGAEEGTLKGDIIPAFTERPGSDIQLGCTIEVIGDGARGDMQAESDLTMSQLSLIFETKDFFELSHGDRPRRHALSSFGSSWKVRV